MDPEMYANLTHGYTFHWKIENPNDSLVYKGERLDSPTFIADSIEGTKWSLILYPIGDLDDNYTGFFLHRDADCTGPDRIEIGFQLFFRSKDNIATETKFLAKQIFFKNETHGFSKFMDRKKLVATRKEMFPITGSEKELFYLGDIIKLECTIWTRVELFSLLLPKSFYARTFFKVKRNFFCWRIDKFKALDQDAERGFKDNQIDFNVDLKGARCLEKELIININFIDESIKYFSLKTSFENSDGKKEKCGIHEYFADDLKKEELHVYLFTKMGEGKIRRIQTMDDLLLNFEYVKIIKAANYVSSNNYTNPPILSETVVENKKDQSVLSSTLLDELKCLYNDGIFSDIELRISSKIFKAHKNILSARSPVFRSMFSIDMKEKSTGHVSITDFDEGTVQKMLLYMYTDSLEGLQFESASNLYRIADKYEIMSLKNKCSSFLKGNLSVENACDVLLQADLHSDEDLKSTVEDYILGKKKQVFCSQEWKHFMSTHVKLAADVMYKKIYEE